MALQVPYTIHVSRAITAGPSICGIRRHMRRWDADNVSTSSSVRVGTATRKTGRCQQPRIRKHVCVTVWNTEIAAPSPVRRTQGAGLAWRTTGRESGQHITNAGVAQRVILRRWLGTKAISRRAAFGQLSWPTEIGSPTVNAMFGSILHDLCHVHDLPIVERDTQLEIVPPVIRLQYDISQ